MHTQIEVNHILSFTHLPSFAQYLITHRLEDFSRAYKKEVSTAASTEQENLLVIDPAYLLESLSSNQPHSFINNAVEKWLKGIDNNDDRAPITASGFMQAGLAVKKTLLQFIADFSRDSEQMLRIIEDSDVFVNSLQSTAAQSLLVSVEELQKTEADFQHAQILAGIGNWKWHVPENRMEWTDHLYRMYGLEPQSETITIERFFEFIRLEDRETVEKAFNAAASMELLDITFRITTVLEEEKWIRCIAQAMVNEEEDMVTVMGTAQDVTERQQMIENISHTESLYKQAEKLAMIGSWSWDIENNRVEWTDELFRIFRLDPDSGPINFELYTSLIHPQDRDRVVKVILDAVHNKSSYQVIHRILLPDGEVRTIQSHGEMLTAEGGKRAKLVGTAQDVTERNELIDQLQESENLYKQAQSLARIGNFNWNVETNEVFWSDEIYNIYEIPIGSPVTFDSAFQPIVNGDKERVKKAIEESFAAREGKSVSYAIDVPGGRIKYIHLETELHFDEDDHVINFLGTAQDITERQLLIEQLQESQRVTQQAQSLAHIGNWVLDLKTMEFKWSDEMYNIYEIERSTELSREDWESYIHPEEKAEVISYFWECIAAKKNFEIQHRIVLPDGKQKVLFRKGELILDENGEPVRMLGTTQDVTEQHRVQEALRSNQQFIRKIADATPSIIASYNINTGKYTFVSGGIEKLLGYNPQEVLDQGIHFFANIIHPDDAPGIMEKNQAALEMANKPENREQSPVEEFRYRMKHRDGEYRWFHTYGTIFDRNAEGKVEHVLNISLDITDQIAAEEKIVEQQFFIEQVADASPTILYLFDISSNSISYVNKEIFFILGYTTEEIVAMGDKIVATLYHPDDIELLPERRESIKKFQLRNSMIQYECRMRTKDGDWNWILVREVVFKTDENGDPLQILGAALDISKRKEIESTLLQNSFKLQQSNSSLEEFAYVASHDLKEPLRKISTFGDRLMQTQVDRLGEDGKIYLRKIVDASQRMQIMINDLLSISMITGNRSFEPYSLQSILEDVKQTLEFKIEQKKAVVEGTNLPVANIVPSQFRQLFQNLLSNSLKFVKEDRRPVITIQCDYLLPEQTTGYQLPKAEKYLRLLFTDNGIGFEDEFAGKIFQIFQRLHGRSEYEGTGIGLAICKKIVEHHGGVIYAEGKPDVGSVFTIILPA